MIDKHLSQPPTELYRAKLEVLLNAVNKTWQGSAVNGNVLESDIKDMYHTALSLFLESLEGSLLEPAMKIHKGLPADPYDYNVFFNALRQDLDVLFAEIGAVDRLVSASFNALVAEREQVLQKTKEIGNKLGDYLLYSDPKLGAGFFFGDSFSTNSRIERGSSLVEVEECYHNIEEGILLLPLDGDVEYPKIQSIIINRSSNGTVGHNFDADILPGHEDIEAIGDNEPNTWFEYESITVTESAIPLILDLTLTLEKASVINHIHINPVNFGTPSPVKIKTIATSADGIEYLSIKSEVPIRDFMSEDERDIFSLSPSASKYSGQGFYSFLPRKIRFIHVVFEQDVSYIINTSSGFRNRYAIGIRDINILGRRFKTEGSLVSTPFTSEKEVKKLSLWVSENPVYNSSLTTIKHSVSHDDGAKWNQIQPQRQIGFDLPEILNFNNTSSDSFLTAEPVKSLRHKISLTRDPKAFDGEIVLKQRKVRKAETVSFNPSGKISFQLKEEPVVDSVRLNMPFMGSFACPRRNKGTDIRGLSKSSSLDHLEFTADSSSTGTVRFDLPFRGVERLEHKIRVFVNGEQWEYTVKDPDRIGFGTSFLEEITDRHTARVGTTEARTMSLHFDEGSVIDGVILTEGDRLLIKDQVDRKENGLYIVQESGAPSRAIDLDTDDESFGVLISFEEGATQIETSWRCSNESGSDVTGTDNLAFVPPVEIDENSKIYFLNREGGELQFGHTSPTGVSQGMIPSGAKIEVCLDGDNPRLEISDLGYILHLSLPSDGYKDNVQLVSMKSFSTNKEAQLRITVPLGRDRVFPHVIKAQALKTYQKEVITEVITTVETEVTAIAKTTSPGLSFATSLVGHYVPIAGAAYVNLSSGSGSHLPSGSHTETTYVSEFSSELVDTYTEEYTYANPYLQGLFNEQEDDWEQEEASLLREQEEALLAQDRDPLIQLGLSDSDRMSLSIGTADSEAYIEEREFSEDDNEGPLVAAPIFVFGQVPFIDGSAEFLDAEGEKIEGAFSIDRRGEGYLSEACSKKWNTILAYNSLKATVVRPSSWVFYRDSMTGRIDTRKLLLHPQSVNTLSREQNYYVSGTEKSVSLIDNASLDEDTGLGHSWHRQRLVKGTVVLPDSLFSDFDSAEAVKKTEQVFIDGKTELKKFITVSEEEPLDITEVNGIHSFELASTDLNRVLNSGSIGFDTKRALTDASTPVNQFVTKIEGAPVDNGDWTYTVDPTTKVVTVSVKQTEGLNDHYVSYEYSLPNSGIDHRGLYSVDYNKGIAYFSNAPEEGTHVIAYETTMFSAFYNITESIPKAAIASIDVEEKTIELTEGFSSRFLKLSPALAARPQYLRVLYQYYKKQKQSLKELEPYFSPMVKDVAFKAVTIDVLEEL